MYQAYLQCAIHRNLTDRPWLELKTGSQPLPVSRSYAHLFRQM